MKTINLASKLEAYALMKGSKGKVFTVIFKKKDGSIRKMNCRLGVQKNLTGKGLAYNPLDKLLLCVYDMQSKGYRMVNLNTVISLRIDKQNYTVNEV